LINTDSNLGGSGGFELGVKNIPHDTDYVLLIDDDAMLAASFLEEIDKHRENGVLAYSGTIRTDGVIDTSHRRRLKNKILMTKTDVPVEEYKKDSFLFDLATFCGLMVSKDVIEKIGLPKGEYFIWYDDTEYCLRVMKYSKIKNVNSANINHKTKIFNETDLNWKSYYGYRNQIDVGKRYSKVPFIYHIYRYAYHRFRMVYFSLLSRKHPDDEYYKECVKLHNAVIRDSKEGKLGLSNDFYPGKKLR
jgi:GT2 family glycosyltransferase